LKRIFSGIQPSGELHIGNWLGAVQNWVNLQYSYETLICVVDLHAITGKYDHETLTQRTLEMASGLLSAGIDPERSVLFVQSHVPEHTELQFLLNTVTPLGELERMTQFKDKSQKFESVPAGLLNYPVLMAADILLYRADLVPVGEDQPGDRVIEEDVVSEGQRGHPVDEAGGDLPKHSVGDQVAQLPDVL
jgi:tryptophanyl-tRNA synthetase